jgi:glycine oxidase
VPVNVTIVGGGIVGCAIAHELVSRGARVRVVDPRGTGQGATRASAGILAPHIEGHIEPLHRLGIRSLALYDTFIERLRGETDQPVEYERAGTLQVARDGDDLERLRDQATRLSATGVTSQLLSRADVRRAEFHLAEWVAGGLLIPDQGYVTVTPLVNALAAAAEKRGARFVSERVIGVHGSEHGARVATMDGTIDGDAVVIAAGAWSPEIMPVAGEPPQVMIARGMTPPVKPIRGQLLQLRAVNRAAKHVVWSSGCYVVPWQNGTSLVGATVEDVGFHETATAEGVQSLLTAATSLLPDLASAAFEGVRVGLRPMTSDELPVIGPSSTLPNVFFATGHYRNGILLAPLTAAIVADYLLAHHEAPELAFMRPSRFGL